MSTPGRSQPGDKTTTMSLSVPDGSTTAPEQTACFLKDNLLGDSFFQLEIFVVVSVFFQPFSHPARLKMSK